MAEEFLLFLFYLEQHDPSLSTPHPHPLKAQDLQGTLSTYGKPRAWHFLISHQLFKLPETCWGPTPLCMRQEVTLVYITTNNRTLSIV